jgi:hypothetical protein
MVAASPFNPARRGSLTFFSQKSLMRLTIGYRSSGLPGLLM